MWIGSLKRLWLILFLTTFLFGQSSTENKIDSLKTLKSQKENLIKSLKKDIEALEIQISESEKIKIRNEYLPNLKNGFELTMSVSGFFLKGGDKPSPVLEFSEFSKGNKIKVYPELEPYGSSHAWRAEYDGYIGWISSFHIGRDEKKLPFYLLFKDQIISIQQDKKGQRTEAREKRYERFPSRFRNYIKNGSVRIGMTREMVIAAIGVPKSENKTTYSFGTRNQMVYNQSKYDYIYLENGIVSAIQE